MTNKLVLENNVQIALFVEELQGQFSDGHWENASPRNHYDVWCDLQLKDITVGEKIGRNFYPRRDTYGLTSSALLDVVGQRMLHIARLAQFYRPEAVGAHLWELTFESDDER